MSFTTSWKAILLGKIAVVIPCKNEEKSIQEVLDLIEENVPEAQIILVDDNSEKEEKSVRKRSIQIHYLRSPINLGIGGAVQLGVQYAYKRGFDTFVRIDGDGQHPPKHIRDLIELCTPGTLVRGVRSKGQFIQTSSLFRRLGSLYFMGLFRIFFNRHFPDPTSGFHCFNRDIAKKFSKYYPMDYPEIESSVLLLKSGFSIRHLPVTMNSRKEGHSSINFIHSMVYVFSVTIAFIIALYKKNPYDEYA